MKNIIITVFFLFSLVVFGYHFYKILFVIPESVVDFWQYYEVGQNLQLGRIPYFPGNLQARPITYYPPSIFPLFFVFSLLPARISLALWQVLSLLLLIASILIILKALSMKLKFPEILLLFGLTILSFPIKDTFWLGSINFLELFLFSLALYYYTVDKRTRHFASCYFCPSDKIPQLCYLVTGVFIGLTAAIRPFALIYIFFFLWKRNYKAILAVLVTFISTQIISAILFGVANVTTYYLVIWPWLILYELGKASAYNQALLGFLIRQFGKTNFTMLINTLTSIAFMAVSLIFLKRKKGGHKLLLALEFSSFIPLTFLIKSYSWRHHGVLLLIPIIVLWYYLQKTSASRWGYLFLGLIILLFMFGFAHPPTSDKHLVLIFGRSLGNLITSHFLIGVVFLWLWYMRILRRSKADL